MTRAAYPAPTPYRDRTYQVSVPLAPLLRLLRVWNRRWRFIKTVVWFPRGIIIGLIATILIAVVVRLRPLLLPEQVSVVCGILLLISSFISCLVVWLWPRSILRSARYFDRHFGLRERISTAFEMNANMVSAPDSFETFKAIQLRDAITQAEQISVLKQLPIQVNWREWLICTVLIIICGLLIFLPNPQSAIVTQQNALSASIAQQITQLQQIKQAIQANSSLSDAQKAALQGITDQAIQQLSQPNISQAEAVAAMSQAAQQFNSNQAQLSTAQQQADKQAGQALNSSTATSSASAAQAMGAALQKGDLAQAASAAQSLARQDGQLTPDQAANTANTLNQAATALDQTNPAVASSLRQAAQALQQENTAAASAALNQVANAFLSQQTQLSQAPQSLAAQQAAQQAIQGQQQLAQLNQTGQSGNSVGTPASNGNNPPAGTDTPNAAQSTDTVGQTASPGTPSAQSGSSSNRDQSTPSGQQSGQPSTQSGNQQSGQTGSGQTTNQSGSNNPNSQTGNSAGSQTSNSANNSGQPNSSTNNSNSSASSGGAGQGSGGTGQNTTTGNNGQSGISSPGNTMPTDNGHGNGSIVTNEHVYAPSFVGGTGGTALNPNSNNPNGNGAPVQQGGYQTTQDGVSTVPLTNVAGLASSQADAAMDTDHVPIALRGVIHDYFSGLQPAPSQSTAPNSTVP